VVAAPEILRERLRIRSTKRYGERPNSTYMRPTTVRRSASTEPNHDTTCSPKQTEAGRDDHHAPFGEMTITEHDPEE